MKLHYTPKSHFARKVRILLDGWGADVELVDAGNVADHDRAAFGDNPLMKVPCLVDDDETVVFDSDHIAAHLTRKLDQSDRFDVLTTDVAALNARAVMNGAMASEVELLLARRTGLDITAHARFDKHRDTLRHSLDWLEEHARVFDGEPTYLGFHLVSFLDHLAQSPDLAPIDHPRLQAKVANLHDVAWIAASAPPR